MQFSFSPRGVVVISLGLMLLAGCSKQPEQDSGAPAGSSSTSTTAPKGNIPPQMSQEAARASAEASAQAAGRAAAAGQQPR